MLPTPAEEALRLALEQEEEGSAVRKATLVAGMPMLSSDFGDRRAQMGDVWRVRRRQAVLGFPGGEGWAEKMMGDGEGLVYRRRQRVYGCENYPWGEISAVLKRLRGEGGEDGGGTASGEEAVGGS